MDGQRLAGLRCCSGSFSDIGVFQTRSGSDLVAASRVAVRDQVSDSRCRNRQYRDNGNNPGDNLRRDKT